MFARFRGTWLRLSSRQVITGFVLVLILAPLVLQAQVKKPSSGTAKKGNKGGLASDALSSETIQQHRKELLEGVTEITTTGIPGPLSVFGPQAFPVVVDTSGKKLTVLVAAAQWNKGRVVAFPHPGYLQDAVNSHEQTGRLLLNSIGWAAGRKIDNSRQPVRVVVRNYKGTLEKLKASPIQWKELPAKNWANQLTGADVVVMPLEDTSPEERKALEKFVTGGGGLISASLIWGWQQGHPKERPVDHGGNQLVVNAGFVWADGYAPTSSGKLVTVSDTGLEFAHYSHMLTALEQSVDGSRQLSRDELSQIDSVISVGVDGIPEPADSQLRKQVADLLIKTEKKIVIPSSKAPLKTGTLGRTLIGLQTQFLQQVPVVDLQKAAAATEFPGAVASSAPRVTRRITVTTEAAGWRSTGLYAAPGDKITVKVGDAATRGFTLQIGCHKDQLWHLDEWKRLPDVVRRFPMNKATVEIGHALGGPIYVDVPDSATGKPITLEFSKVVEAPYYVHGSTSVADWNSKLSALPAPWAELETRNVIISVPSELIRDLTAPDELMEFWTKVVDACADLAAIPHERKRPERFVFDVQISAGWLHSGYPIMGHLQPTSKEIVDLRNLKTKGGWGFYHELGHNHQKGEWTFEGTGEVTCNLFSLYVPQMLAPDAYLHDAVQPAHQAKLEKEYIASGDYAKWKSDPFLALIMYDQMHKEFGWEPFKKVFAEYRDLPANQRPKTDDEKRDQWMVRFSKTVGRNLGPFFEYWKIPTSSAARQSIANLPTWMPKRAD